jgi:hypothetical protein
LPDEQTVKNLCLVCLIADFLQVLAATVILQALKMRLLLLLHIILLLAAVPVLAQDDSVSLADTPKVIKELERVKEEKFVLSKIHVTGNRKTRRAIILREMSVQEGDSLTRKELADVIELNRKRVFNLAIFTDVQINTDSLSANAIEWTIVVKEQWYLIPEFSFNLADRNFNVWWVEKNHDIRRANIGVTLKNKNFRGNLEQLGIIAQVGYTQKFGLEYKRPYVDKRQRHGIGAKVFASRNEEWFYRTDKNKWEFVRTPGSYVTNGFEASVSYSYRPAYATRHEVELRYKNHQVKDTILKLNPNYFLNGNKEMQLMELVYRYELNHVDNWNYSLQGLKVIGYAILRAGWQGFKVQNLYQGEVGYFQPWGHKIYTSHIFRGRISYPEKQPYVYSYAMGTGSEYIRGYEYYVIDGSDYGILRTNLKYELLNVVIRNIPFRYLGALPIRIYPKVYTDIGYGRNKFPGSSYLNNRMLYSAGFGVDIVSVYDFKMRVEYTWNHLGEKGLFLNFTKGE